MLLPGAEGRVLWVRVKGEDGCKDTYIALFWGLCEGEDEAKVKEKFAKLEKGVERWKAKGRVIVMGDFNGRVGKKWGARRGDGEPQWAEGG